MQGPVKCKIAEVASSSITYIDPNGQYKTLGINSITMNNKKVKSEEISTSDEIELKYIAGRLAKTTLIKSSNPQPPNPFAYNNPPEIVYEPVVTQGRVSLYLTNEELKQFHEPTPTFQISPIQPLSQAPFNDEFNKATLSTLFSAFRKIKPGLSNFSLAFIIGLFDHCVIYNKIEVLNIIKSTLSTHQLQLLNSLDEMIPVINKIEEVIRSNLSNNEKLEIIHGVYESYINELELTVRNLIKIQAELMYYRKEYELFRFIKPLDILINACKSGVFESYDFVYLLNLCKMQMRIIDAKGMTIMTQGSKCEHIFYMLQTENNDYCTIYTKHEYYLQNYQWDECLKMLNFMDEMRNAQFNDKIASLNHMDKSIKDLDKKTSDITVLLKDLLQISGCNLDFNSIGEIVNDESLAEACCAWCRYCVNTVEFPCGHLLCYNCSYSNYTEYYRACAVCKLCAEASVIDSQFTNQNAN